MNFRDEKVIGKMSNSVEAHFHPYFMGLGN